MGAPLADVRPPVRQRGFFAIRWRQFRNAPRPVVRAVVSSLVAAVAGGLAFEVYDVALDRGAVLPGGDLRILVLTVYVLAVLVIGSLVTYLVVPLPSGAGRPNVTRTPWSAMLGLLAAGPVVYLVLVVLHEILKPLLLG